MFVKRIMAYVSCLIAVISIILAVVARLLLADKMLLGLSALSYLRITNTMLLFTIVFLVFEYVRKKE